MTAAELLDVTEVERLRLGPDDALVIKYQHYFDEEQLANIHKTMERAFPGTKLLVLEGGMDIAVLRAEETPPA